MALQILIADDEPHISRALAFVLEREGYNVDVANNGEEALRKIREGKPQMVFLDLVMPKMSGLDICKKIKADREMMDTYVIILTAKAQELNRTDCISAGADSYLTKPFSPRQVLEQVQQFFAKR